MPMRKFWYVDFEGFCVVEGRDRDEAEYNFFMNIHPDVQSAVSGEVYQIKGIEPCESEDESNV